MKKNILLLVLCWTMTALAQEVVPYALVTPNATVTYALSQGEKRKPIPMGNSYYRIGVTNVSTSDDGSQNVTYRLDILDKKIPKIVSMKKKCIYYIKKNS